MQTPQFGWASVITGLEYGMERLVEWKMEWNSEGTQLQLTRVTGDVLQG